MSTRLVVTAAGAIALSTSAATASSPFDVQWSTANSISAVAGSDADVRLTMSQDGSRLTAVWMGTGSPNRIFAASSADRGLTWTAQTPVSGTLSAAEFPDVVASDDGLSVTALWYGQPLPPVPPSNDVVLANRSSDGGVTWGTPVIVQNIGNRSGNPQLSTSGDGAKLVATWSYFDGVNDIVEVGASTDSGSTWPEIETLSNVSDSAGDQRASVSADGSAFLSAYSEGSSTSLVKARTSSDGSVWQAATTLSAPGQSATQSHIVQSSDGDQATIAWLRSDSTNTRVQARSTSNGGGSWSDAVDVSPVGEDAGSMTLAASADGRTLVAVWLASDSSDPQVKSSASTDGGVTWSDPETHSEAGADNPAVAVSSDGSTATLIWFRLRSGDPSVVETVTSNDGGHSWPSARSLSDPSNDAVDPDTAASANGRSLAATWSGSDGSDFRIQYSGGTLRTVPGAPPAANATPGDAQLDAAWNPPADDGGSTVTSYTATASPGGQTCATTATACTIGGLANGTTYTVTVTATNAIGTGPASAASNAVIPSAPPVPAPPAPPAPPPADLDDSDPLTTKVIAKANDAKSKLKVKIKPDLGKKKQWEFVVKVKKKGDWKTIKTKKDKTKVYETEGPDHTLTIDLDEGKYKAKSKEARGHVADTSDVVKLKK